MDQLCHSHPAPIYSPPRTTTPITSTFLSCFVIFRFYGCFGYSYLNFVANCLTGYIDHSARVMHVITWNRSLRGLPNVDDGKDDFQLEEHITQATVLDKLLAWEKLYDEVKVYCSISFCFVFTHFVLKKCCTQCSSILHELIINFLLNYIFRFYRDL